MAGFTWPNQYLKSLSFCSRSQAESPHIFCSTMDFVRESAFAGAMRNSGSVWRNAFATRRNEAQRGLDELDRLTEQWVADHLQRCKTSKNNKELVTLEFHDDLPLRAHFAQVEQLDEHGRLASRVLRYPLEGRGSPRVL